jgi:hypothetical protein
MIILRGVKEMDREPLRTKLPSHKQLKDVTRPLEEIPSKKMYQIGRFE